MIPRQPSPAEQALIEDTLLAARLARPYYARAIRALTPYVVEEGLPTVAVGEGCQLYFGLKWLEGTPPGERGLIVAAHEIEHILRHHAGRRLTREQVPWNIAGDAEINDDSPELAGLGGVFPKHLGCQDGLTAEEYYENMSQKSKAGQCCGGGSGAGNPLEGEVPGSASEGLTPDQTAALRTAVAADVRSYVQANGRGSVPEGVLMWADQEAERLTPSWPRELFTVCSRAVQISAPGRADYSRALHRRQRPGQPLRPSMVSHPPRIAVVVDTSGSMSSDGPIVLGVLAAIRKLTANPTVIACDAAVHSKTRKKKAQLLGGGGTDLRPAMLEADKDHDVIVVITDCETPWPEPMKHFTAVVSTQGVQCPAWTTNVVVK